MSSAPPVARPAPPAQAPRAAAGAAGPEPTATRDQRVRRPADPAGSIGSAVYEGWVTHRRTEPIEHSFRYRVFMPLFDLGELPHVLDRHPLWSARRPALARFRRADYLPDHPGPLAEAARSIVAEQTGLRLDGPVRILTNPRYFGIGFNPVSFYFLYDGSGERAEALLAEVTNTPWGERRSYAIARNGNGRLEGWVAKELHVSPFMPMNQTYELSAGDPGEALGVRIANEQEGRIVFEASIALRRQELTRSELSRVLLSYPPMTAAVLARIYWNALKLKLKGARYVPHPDAKPR